MLFVSTASLWVTECACSVRSSQCQVPRRRSAKCSLPLAGALNLQAASESARHGGF